MNLKAIQVVNNLQCSLHVTGNERPFGRLSQEVLGAGAKNGHGLDHRADGTDMHAASSQPHQIWRFFINTAGRATTERLVEGLISADPSPITMHDKAS